MIAAMLAGGGLFLAGAVLGLFIPARKRTPKPVRPVCGCKHHHSMHDPATGQCHGLVEGGSTAIRDAKNNPVLDDFGYVQKTHEKIQCTCRRYSGPEPLPEFYAPEIAEG